MYIPILQGDFESIIAKETLPVVIEFFAVWCPKCSMMAPVYERVASSLSSNMKFYKVDIDISENEIKHLGIEIVPTFVIFHNQKILGYTIGVLSESTLKQRILECVKS